MGSPSPEEASLMQFKKAVEDHWEDPLKPAYRIDRLNPSSTGTPVYICFEAERDRDEDEEKLYLYYIILATDVKVCLEDDHISQHGHKAVWALLMGPLLPSS